MQRRQLAGDLVDEHRGLLPAPIIDVLNHTAAIMTEVGCGAATVVRVKKELGLKLVSADQRGAARSAWSRPLPSWVSSLAIARRAGRRPDHVLAAMRKAHDDAGYPRRAA